MIMMEHRYPCAAVCTFTLLQCKKSSTTRSGVRRLQRQPYKFNL